MKLFNRNLWDTSGQAAIIFGLAIIPIISVAGFAIDFQRTVQQKQKVQLVLDSAVLAAARIKQSGATDDEVKQAAQLYMDAQLNSIGSGMTCNPATITVGSTVEEIEASMLCSQPTTLMHIVGTEKVDFRVSAASEYGIDKLDVAFMFDVSGSMNSNDRLTNLKAAAKEAVKVLLPDGASPELIEDTRLAMVSYNSMVNAGDYFEAATGVEPTRTYTHLLDPFGHDMDPSEGDLFDELEIGLYDADTDELISLIGQDAVIEVEDHQIDDLTIGVYVRSTNTLYGQVESMRLQLSGTESKNRNDNGEPYSLYGDSGGNFSGENWGMGYFEIRLRAYEENNRNGTKLFDETIDFAVMLKDAQPETKTYTLTSTCVWERDGDEAFTDAAPGTGAYLSYQQAWFEEDSSQSDGGDWITGHPNRGDHSSYRGNECRDHEPVELTNDRTVLNNYITSLTAGGGTGGHLGIAWSWYLVSENWNQVFDGTAAPLAYAEPDAAKAVILMTDGEFNREIFPGQGDSDAQARAVCDEMKKTNIKIYSVALNAPTAGKQVLAYCASGTDYYYEPETAAELTDAYKQIATSISDLRISK